MSVPTASAKELFVLGRLSVRPTHGHEIMLTLAESRSDLWVGLSEKHVYYILRKLESNGLVRVEERVEGGRPPRRVFSLTPAGLAEFDRLICADSLIESASYSEFDVVFGMLSYTDRLAPSDKTTVLERRGAHLRSVIADATAASILAAQTGAPAMPARVFDKVIRVAAAELEWLQEVLAEVERDGWPMATRNDSTSIRSHEGAPS
jgi:DNA-binding PadR family transcriptional regulator